MPSLDLEGFLPAGNFRDDDTGDLASWVTGVLQPVLDLLQAEADRWARQADPNLAASNTIDAMLLDLGNPFDELTRNLPVDRRRLLVQNLVTAYRLNGTPAGLIAMIRAITGVGATVIYPVTLSFWELGIEVLGEAGVPVGDPSETDIAFLGPGDRFLRYSFQVLVDRDTTEDEEFAIGQIARGVKPAHTHFLGIVEPGDVVVAPDHWELGLSEVDTQALLH